MSRGWISIHRKLMDNAIYSDSDLLKLWLHCLLKCTHTDYQQMVGNTLVELAPGQFVTGRISLAEEFNKGVIASKKLSDITLWRKLKFLEKIQMLNIKTTNKYSVVTVINWHEYQDGEQQMNNKRTTNEQQMNTNNNSNNINNKNMSPKQVYDETSDFYKLASLLHERMKANNENIRPANLQKWSDEIRIMIERDNRNYEQVKYLIEWSQDDNFWHTNILSPSALRRNFDKMVLQVKSSKQPNKGNQVSPPQYADLGGREY
ncbi:replication protein [Sporosarcina sp. Sa2YVA2]|uniref:Replication protein n=1 Tax=Sporosarcina quadrami TaxID=2762234 RepID=A0ABR8U8T6_9BACL|nr:replication protein [Sporosarcina quadrami]MBD7984441.1 replication protein [Sporosarcina quadrami]